jgi:hypothetical protein
VTKQEHDLMLTLFATQMQMCGTILELLQSRGVAEPGDLEAFSALALEQTMQHAGKFLTTYSLAAQRCGVELPEGFAPSA